MESYYVNIFKIRKVTFFYQNFDFFFSKKLKKMYVYFKKSNSFDQLIQKRKQLPEIM